MDIELVVYYLELLLIAEKDKMDEYVERCIKTNTPELAILQSAFVWQNTPDGYSHWSEFYDEAIEMMKAGINKLSPCPFCGGGAAEVRHGDHFNFKRVVCVCCECKGKSFDVFKLGEEEASKNARRAWNRRG